MIPFFKPILGGIVAGGVIFLLFYGLSSETSKPATGIQSEAAELRWREEITLRGPQEAYKQFLAETAELTPQARHIPGHIFGGALFKEAGLSGMPVCDERASGCLHQFIEEALYTHGIGAIFELEEACTQTHEPVEQFQNSWLKFVPCQHALGHGLVANFGYEIEDLLRALETCQELTYFQPLMGCERGVFMEYSMRTFLGPNEARVVTEDSYGGPCALVPQKHRPACYYSLPQWWLETLISKEPSTATTLIRLGDRCRAVGGAEFAPYCFEGIGLAVALLGPVHTESLAQLCEAALPSSEDWFLCKSHAAFWLAYSLKAEPSLPIEPKRLCEGLTGTALRYCSSMAENTATIKDFTTIPHPDS